MLQNIRRSIRSFAVPLTALAVLALAGARNAAADEPSISILPGETSLGNRTAGSDFTVNITVFVFGVGTDVDASVQAPNKSIDAITPESQYISATHSANFEVRGKVPSASGQFRDEIAFTYSNSSGPVTFTHAIYGNSVPPGGSNPGPPTYQVGVIPQTASCPDGSPLITIHMDDEDTNNANARSGWIGAITSDRNTTFRFCRVDGRRFFPLSSANALANHYAVLKLGNSCPNGSTEFWRRFDNQHRTFFDNNDNWASSSSGNIRDILPNESSSTDGLTYLYFCLFKSGTSVMNDFPSLGIHYGVFAAPGFSRAVSSGWLFTDDEDRNPVNNNYFRGDSDGRRMVAPTNSDGRNTTLYTARVTPETRPVARCDVSPSSGVDAVEATFADNGSYARGSRSIASYSWSFSDGGAAYGPGPHYRYVAAYSGSTSLTGTLTVTDTAGESSSASCSVYVSSSSGCGASMGVSFVRPPCEIE